eukprot:3874480-Alexandrium_andersonii.AAC.1
MQYVEYVHERTLLYDLTQERSGDHTAHDLPRPTGREAPSATTHAHIARAYARADSKGRDNNRLRCAKH